MLSPNFMLLVQLAATKKNSQHLHLDTDICCQNIAKQIEDLGCTKLIALLYTWPSVDNPSASEAMYSLFSKRSGINAST